MKKSFKSIIASVLTLSLVFSMTACGESEGDGEGTTASTTPELVTLDTDVGVQDAVGNIADDVKDATLNVTKKLKWLSWYPIDETSPTIELFKTIYGTPEMGDASYGDFADMVVAYDYVAYADRYTKLATLVQAGDSPDLFPFEIQNFPYSVYQNLFQSIDGIIDTNSEEWSDTRNVMDLFMWGGKNWCAIATVGTFSLLWYRRSVMEEAGLTDPYVLYNNGEWTWDKFLEYCKTFSDPESGKFCLDGWNPENSFIGTTGTPLVAITDGKLQNNLYNANVERAMDMISTLCTQNYRYPRHELNNHNVNLMAFINGDTLFYDDGRWAFETARTGWAAARDKFQWDADEVFFVPFPRDPNSDTYYQMQKQDAFMLVAGSQNIDGFKAFMACDIACTKNADVKAAARAKAQKDYGWTDEALDFLDRIISETSPVFDFKNGIGEDIAGTSSAATPIEALTKGPYVTGEKSYTMLRAENEGVITERINTLNSSLS